MPGSLQGQKAPVILSIAGFDPSSGAGITADLRVIQDFGFSGMAVITALTVQNTSGAAKVEPVSGQVVTEMLEKLAAETGFAAIKVGMLATSQVCTAVADFLADHNGVKVVLDPVLRASSGIELLDISGISVLKGRLLALTTVLTPNLPEAEVLTGLSARNRDEIRRVAKGLQELGARNVVITGGHSPDNADYLLTESDEGRWVEGERLGAADVHGTGCVYSTALTCCLAQEMELPDAAIAAKAYVIEAVRHGLGLEKSAEPTKP